MVTGDPKRTYCAGSGCVNERLEIVEDELPLYHLVVVDDTDVFVMLAKFGYENKIQVKVLTILAKANRLVIDIDVTIST